MEPLEERGLLGRTASSVSPGSDELLELLPTYEPLGTVVEPHLEPPAPEAQLPVAAVFPLATQSAVSEDALAGLASPELPEVVLQVSASVDVTGVRDGPVHLRGSVSFRNGRPSPRRIPYAALTTLYGLRHRAYLLLLSCNVEGIFARQHESAMRESLESG